MYVVQNKESELHLSCVQSVVSMDETDSSVVFTVRWPSYPQRFHLR